MDGAYVIAGKAEGAVRLPSWAGGYEPYVAHRARSLTPSAADASFRVAAEPLGVYSKFHEPGVYDRCLESWKSTFRYIVTAPSIFYAAGYEVDSSSCRVNLLGGYLRLVYVKARQ